MGMFTPYGDESPAEMRAIRDVNLIGFGGIALIVAIFVVMAVIEESRTECLIPERCAAETP